MKRGLLLNQAKWLVEPGCVVADFEAAIRRGATHVRVGSALFGLRA